MLNKFILHLLFLRVTGQLPPRKIAPLSLPRLGLGLALDLGGNFPRGQLS